MARTKYSMLTPHYEELSTSPKRNRREPRNKKRDIVSMNKPEQKVANHVPLTSHKGVDSGAFASFTRKGHKDKILLSNKQVLIPKRRGVD